MPDLTIMRYTLGLILLLLSTPGVIWAQKFPQGNSDALRGVGSIDARIFLTWDDRITQAGGPIEATIQNRLTTILELELRRSGVTVESSAPNYLWCRWTLMDDGGLVIYHRDAHFLEVVDRTITPEIETDYAIIWEDWVGVMRVGRDNLAEALEKDARVCAETFLNDYLSVNKPGG